MAQVKIYGLRPHIEANRSALSEAIHAAVVLTLGLPPEKRFHRFFPMDSDDFLFPAEKSPAYTVVEISLFGGRSSETKRELILALFENLGGQLGIAPADVEITIFETPKANWGIRGLPADELNLPYKIEV